MVNKAKVVSLRAADVEPEVPYFLKPEFYPLKTITIYVGNGGAGKSSLVIADIADATHGRFKGDVRHPVNVAIISLEDTPGLQVTRLNAANVDTKRVFFVQIDYTGQGMDYDHASTFRFPRDVPIFEEWCRGNNIRMIVVDPINITMQGDPNKVEVVRNVLDPLAKATVRLNCATICIAHAKKNAKSVSEIISGSAAFRNVARSVLVAARDVDGRGVLQVDKSNYSGAEGKAWEYVFEEVPALDKNGNVFTDPDGNPKTVSRARIVGETDRRVEHILNREPETEEKAEERASAETVIRAYLENAGGSAPANEVIKAMERDGYKASTVRKARSTARPKIHTFDRDGTQVWSLEEPPRYPYTTVTRENVDISTMLPVTSDSPPQVTQPQAEQPQSHVTTPRRSKVTRNTPPETAEYQRKVSVTNSVTTSTGNAPTRLQGTRRYTSDGIEIEFNERQNYWQPTDPTQRRKWQTIYPRPELTPADDSPTQDALDLTA